MGDYSTRTMQTQILHEVEDLNDNINSLLTTNITMLVLIFLGILAYGVHDILNHALGRGE